MKLIKKWIMVCAAVTSLLGGTYLRAEEVMAGEENCCNYYYDDGYGYEDTCCAPNYAMCGAALLAVAAITVAIIALIDDDDHAHAHEHS